MRALIRRLTSRHGGLFLKHPGRVGGTLRFGIGAVADCSAAAFLEAQAAESDLMKYALVILALAASPAAANPTTFSIDELREWCLQGTISNPPAKGPHLSRRQCQRQVRNADRAVREQEKARGNVSVNMGACIFYCEARFPGVTAPEVTSPLLTR
jgi:hypothetical protein